MEWIRDEAVAMKEAAEEKLLLKDLDGAQAFAARAMNLCPNLEGLNQLSAAIGIHVAAGNLIYDEPDWYGVLGVDPHADIETIKKSHRRLALLLHPDKNKAAYADEAFKIISEAWSNVNDLLSRYEYHQRRYGINPESDNHQDSAFPWDHMGGSSSQPGTDHQDFAFPWAHADASSSHPHAPTTDPAPAPAPADAAATGPAPAPAPAAAPEPATAPAPAGEQAPAAALAPGPPRQAAPALAIETTFWTHCRVCVTDFEFMARYRDHRIRCPGCRSVFLAVDNLPERRNIRRRARARAQNPRGAA